MARNADGLGRRPHKWRGRWRAYLTVGYKPDGKPDRRYVYADTQAECQKKLDELRRRHRLGDAGDSSITVAAYLHDWLAQKRREIKPRTVDEYERELAHALPHVGRIKLTSLTATHIQRMMAAVDGSVTTTTTTNKAGKRVTRDFTLTARAANQARGILSNALDDAVMLGVLPANPALRTRPYRHTPEEPTVWTAAEVERFLRTTLAGAAAQHALFYLALTAGLRAGELATLEWTDLDGDRLRVQRSLTRVGNKLVVGQPKSTAARRTLALPTDTRQTLEAHRAALAAEDIVSPLVFPTESGALMTHSLLRRALHRWATRAKVPLIRPHDLRHTYASMAIFAGANPTELARQLGHVDASFTMRRYVHFFERARPREAPTLRALMGGVAPEGGSQGGIGPHEPN